MELKLLLKDIIVVFGLLVNIFERIFTPLAYSYSPELYPVEARGMGSGIPYGIGRLAYLVGPLIISPARHTSVKNLRDGLRVQIEMTAILS